MKSILTLISAIFITLATSMAQTGELNQCNIIWTSQSKNSSESMPCGGGDIGLNVWVENGNILFYISRSGTFDENNGFLKLGRVRIKLNPNPFAGKDFRQELVLKDGYVTIAGSNRGYSAQVKIWVDVFRPAIHIDISGNKAISTEAIYESWRYADRPFRNGETFANSLKWSSLKNLKTFKDDISFTKEGVLFYHRNNDRFSAFDITVHEQGLDSVKSQMFNPLKNLTFGGIMQGQNMEPDSIVDGAYLYTDFKGWKLKSKSPAKTQKIDIFLYTDQVNAIADWQNSLQQVIKDARLNEKTAEQKTREWWKQFWNRSFIYINQTKGGQNTPEWQIGRNYQLFRYMLGCNASGQYPTKFNGGLFTYDPCFTDTSRKFTPDYRNWGGGLMTAQNQRLVYWPMLKNGDFDMMKSEFLFYLRSLHNAELRSKVYWSHAGACFTEQIENFGLPNCAEYGWNHPASLDRGVEYNAWLEYTWDTVLEFCMMMLENERYNDADITEYVPFIESCLTFFNEHYQYLAQKRGAKTFDGEGHLILYPGSGAETYKMAYNSTSTIAALKTVLTRLLELPAKYLNEQEREKWAAMLKRIPPLNFREFDDHKTISPAKLWERINNTEPTQLYPVFPWGIYGVGRPDLDVAINTWKYDTLALKFRSYVGWKQDNIWAPCLGLKDEAAHLNLLKLKDSGRRFPAFWGPGFDWTPDHNWGGSGMIGLQDMLLQTDKDKIYLFPAWPKNWDVHFKLHAPYQTTVEGIVKNGKVEMLKVLPESRMKDVVNMF
ncbi:MAG TPA: DUF5703 domain-containing protein [Bacteroidales bacterium]